MATKKHLDGTEELTSDLKSAVFTMVMANGDESTFDQLVKVSTPCVCVCVCVCGGGGGGGGGGGCMCILHTAVCVYGCARFYLLQGDQVSTSPSTFPSLSLSLSPSSMMPLTPVRRGTGSTDLLELARLSPSQRNVWNIPLV